MPNLLETKSNTVPQTLEGSRVLGRAKCARHVCEKQGVGMVPLFQRLLLCKFHISPNLWHGEQVCCWGELGRERPAVV